MIRVLKRGVDAAPTVRVLFSWYDDFVQRLRLYLPFLLWQSIERRGHVLRASELIPASKRSSLENRDSRVMSIRKFCAPVRRDREEMRHDYGAFLLHIPHVV